MSTLQLVNAQLVNEGRIVATDVLIRGERIERIGAGAVPPGTTTIDLSGKQLLPGLIDDWLDATTSMSGPVPHHLARARARLSLALFRGLLLDLVGTEDRAGVDAAFKQYLVLERLAIEDRPTRRN